MCIQSIQQLSQQSVISLSHPAILWNIQSLLCLWSMDLNTLDKLYTICSLQKPKKSQNEHSTDRGAPGATEGMLYYPPFQPLIYVLFICSWSCTWCLLMFAHIIHRGMWTHLCVHRNSVCMSVEAWRGPPLSSSLTLNFIDWGKVSPRTWQFQLV